jgi:carboxylate-amine ligase
MPQPHVYTIGVEEEFFVFNVATRNVIRRRDNRFLAAIKKRLGNRVTPELLQSQIEVVTPPCDCTRDVRAHLAECRTGLADEGKALGLGIAAVGTFPLAYWRDQSPTPKERYDTVMDDLQMLGQRNMMCGMHVHVAVRDPAQRVPIMQRTVPYLPLLLALSTSSPFWEGHRTGLHGYRLAAYDELPRTGLPDRFASGEEYEEYIAALTSAGVIPDASHIWWAIRPSLAHPTLELRIADVCTRLDDAVAITALFRCLIRAIERDGESFQPLDRVGHAITEENKWRAQRHGVTAAFIDPFGRGTITTSEWLERLLERLAPDIAALESEDDIALARAIVAHGTSADRQLDVYRNAKTAGRSKLNALREVVDWAAQTTAGGTA